MADWRRVAELHAATNVYRRRVKLAASHILSLDRATAGSWAVSCSWGKDSTALVALAVATMSEPPRVFHLASPYALPGADKVAAWAHDRCRVEVVPYAKCLSEYVAWLQDAGLGFEREDKSAGAAAKVEGGAEWATSRGVAGLALGLRRQESARRTYITGGPVLRKSGLVMANPLADWTAADVWTYTHQSGLPYHPMYDAETHGYSRETIRNGGWLTTIDPGRIPWLRRHYPKQYRMLEDAFPYVRSF